MKYQKRNFLILIFLFLGALTFAQQKEVDIGINKKTSLEDVISKLENDYGFLFSYKQEDIQGLTFQSLPDKNTIDVFLTQLLKNSNLAFEIVEGNYILLSKKDIPEVEKLKPLLCGNIIDSLTQLPLSLANVYFQKNNKGATTKEDGSFGFRTNFEKEDSIVISYVGYEEKRLPASFFYNKNCPTISLNYYKFSDDLIVITDYLTDGIQLYNRGDFTVLEPDKIGALPGQVEPDVLSTVQFLPGVNSPDGTVSGISIRGGTPDQNLILWEDIPVYHSAHYFGMISAFNPYIINKVAVYRGGFGAEYGGRISGVIDLKSEIKANEKPKFGAGTNFISAFTNGELSTKDQKLSVIYSLRRSMTELWRSPGFNNITQRIQQGVLVQNVDLNRLPSHISIEDEFNFFDANLKANYQFSKKDRVSFALLYADNAFEDLVDDSRARQLQQDTLNLKNRGGSISWEHQWQPGFTSKLLGLNSHYNYNYGYSLRKMGDEEPDIFGAKKSKIQERQIHLLNTYRTKTKHAFKLGYKLTNYDVAYQILKTTKNGSKIEEEKDLITNIHTLYTAFNSSKENRFGVDVGLRLNIIGHEKESCLEPRFRLWYDVNPNLNIYGGAGKYYQFLSQVIEIEGDNSSIETPVWTLSGGQEVPVLTSNQFNSGFIFRKKSWLLDIQVYSKKVEGHTSLSTGFDEDISSRFHIGNSKAQGIDVLLKKRWPNFQSWISYSLSNVDYHFDTFFDKDFPSPIEQRHVFNWANKWSVGNFECSLGWKVSSGRPYALIDNFEIHVASPNTSGPRESIRPIVNDFNTENLPMNHQLDASFIYNFSPKKGKDWKGIVGVSFFNIYHQRNILNRKFHIKERPNGQLILEYNDLVNIGFNTNFVVRFEF